MRWFYDHELADELRAFRDDPQIVQSNREWLATRPQCIRDLVQRYPSNRLYRLIGGCTHVCLPPQSIVSIASYFEDGSLGVMVLRAPVPWDPILAKLRHRISPCDLEPYEPSN